MISKLISQDGKSEALGEAAGPESRTDAGQHSITQTPSNFLNFYEERPLPQPVFLNSSFRTSSTWLWKNLRCLPNVLAYYEIFNEGIAQIDTTNLSTINYASWESHHPPQAPYFLEYLPLLKASGGVNGFDVSMSFDRFMPKGGLQGELSPEECAYLNLLVSQAYHGSKVPLLSCTRSLGRMAAIKRHMPVKNVLVYRNLFHQWASYSGQFLRGNPYFIDTINRTLSVCREDKFLSGIDDVFSGRQSSPHDEKTFSLFLLMHIYLYAHAIDSTDLLVDMTALCNDADLRLSIENDLSRLVLAPVNLSDARLTFDASVTIIKDRSQFVDTIEQFAKLITSTCATERSTAFVHRLKDEALAEWDHYDTLTRQSIGWYSIETGRLQREIDQRTQDIAAVAGERDHISAALVETISAREAVEATRATLQQERDGISAALAETVSVREAAEATVAILQQEHDNISIALEEAMKAHEAAEILAATLRQERDAMAATLAEKLSSQAWKRKPFSHIFKCLIRRLTRVR